MQDFRAEIEIQAPPNVVWAIVRDVERWPEWTPTVTSLRLLDGQPFSVGCRALIHQPKLRPATWSVTELDEDNRTFTWLSKQPGIQIAAIHSVTPSHAGSRAILSVQFTGLLSGFFALLLRGLNNRYLALEANGLKKRSEQTHT